MDTIHIKSLTHTKLHNNNDDLNTIIHRELLLKHQCQDGTTEQYSPNSGQMVQNSSLEGANKVILCELRKSLLTTNYALYQPYSYLASNMVCGGIGTVVFATAVRAKYYKHKVVSTSSRGVSQKTASGGGSSPSKMYSSQSMNLSGIPAAGHRASFR